MHLQALLRLPPPPFRLWQEVVHVLPSVKTIKTNHGELVRGKVLSGSHGSKTTLIYATYFSLLWSWLAIGIGLLCIYSRSRHRKMTLALSLSLPHWGAGISNLLPETYLIIFYIPPTAKYILPNEHRKLCSVHWKIPIAHYTLHTTCCRRHTPDCTL